MDFFDFYNVSANSHDIMELNNKIKELREFLCTYDKSLLKNNNIYLHFENLSNAPDGRFVIPYKGIDFDCLFKRNTISDKLYVIFNGWPYVQAAS